MIIGISGRKCSGKAEIANVLVKNFGFKRLYMALPLKKMISELVGFEINEKQDTKTAVVNKKLTKEDIVLISKYTGIDETSINEEIKDTTFSTVRDMLQIIGTNVIRKHKPTWHIDEVMKLIDNKSSYVIDDIRFPNEKEAIEARGGDVWFIVRPTIDGISNHISETSLSWKDFGNKLILNNIPLKSLTKKWSFAFTEIYLNGKKELRDRISKILEETPYFYQPYNGPWHSLNMNQAEFEMYIKNLMLPYPYLYVSDRFDFINDFPDKDDKTLKIVKDWLTIKRNGIRLKITENPLAIENIKKFL